MVNYNIKAKEGKSETWFNLDELPKINNKWDYNNFVGKKICFKRKHKMNKYDWLYGELEIIKIKKKNNNWFIDIKYLDKEYNNFQLGNILNGCIGNIVDVFNEFRFSDCGTYKIGTCTDGTEFYYDIEDSNKIEEYIWNPTYRNNVDIQFLKTGSHKGKTITLHKFILNENFIDHINNNPCDNRKSNLRKSNFLENNRNLKSNTYYSDGSKGIVGLKECRNKKYQCVISIDGNRITTPSKTKEKALIDTLILQKHYGFYHNEHLYYMLDNIEEEYINNIIEYVQINVNKLKTKYKKSNCINTFILEDDFVWCIVYDKNKNEKLRTKIDYELMEFMKLNGLTCNAGYKNRVIIRGYINGIEVNQILGRFIFDLTKGKYDNWQVCHLNQDYLDNRKCNLIITDKEGNDHNRPGKGYTINPQGNYQVQYMKKMFKNITFSNKEDAENEIKRRKNICKNKRLEFYNKEELDKYIVAS